MVNYADDKCKTQGCIKLALGFGEYCEDHAASQTPESRELRRNLNIAVMANYPGTTASPQFLDDCMMFITAATQASNKALLERLKEQSAEYGYYEATIEAVDIDVIDAELAALERQQLGKESE